MQEIVSFIAIMLGVAILTAWVMWLLLRTSGDSKALQFARESAREGLTSAVMENNHLKNKVKQLERQLKVSLDAGYGNMPTRENTKNSEMRDEDWQDLEARIKEREAELAAEEQALQEKEHELKDEEITLHIEEAELEAGERMLKINQENLKAEEEWLELKEKGLEAEEDELFKEEKELLLKEGELEEEEKKLHAEAEELRLKEAAVRARELELRLKEHARDSEQEDAGDAAENRREDVPDASSEESPEESGQEIEQAEIDDLPDESEEQPAVARSQDLDHDEESNPVPREASEDSAEQAAVAVEAFADEIDEDIDEDYDDEETQPVFHRVTDEAEKKKIDDYLARVQQQAEKQKQKIRALADDNEPVEEDENIDTRSYPDDNLREIKGIGPHLENQLKKAGITSYEQIASFDEDDINRVSKKIGSFPRRIKRESWVKQAKKLLDKD